MTVSDFRQRAIVDTDIPTLENHATGFLPPSGYKSIEGVLNLSREYALDTVDLANVRVLALARLGHDFGQFSNGTIMVYTTALLGSSVHSVIRCAVHRPTLNPVNNESHWVSVPGIKFRVPPLLSSGGTFPEVNIACQRVGPKVLVTLFYMGVDEDRPVVGIPPLPVLLDSTAHGSGVSIGGNKVIYVTWGSTGGITKATSSIYDVSNGTTMLTASGQQFYVGDNLNQASTISGPSVALVQLSETQFLAPYAIGSNFGYVILTWDGEDVITFAELVPLHSIDSRFLSGGPSIRTGYRNAHLVNATTIMLTWQNYLPGHSGVSNEYLDLGLVVDTLLWDGIAVFPTSSGSILPNVASTGGEVQYQSMTTSENGIYVVFSAYTSTTKSPARVMNVVAGFTGSTIIDESLGVELPTVSTSATNSSTFWSSTPEGNALFVAPQGYYVITSSNTLSGVTPFLPDHTDDQELFFAGVCPSPQLLESGSERRYMVDAQEGLYMFDLDESNNILPGYPQRVGAGFLGASPLNVGEFWVVSNKLYGKAPIAQPLSAGWVVDPDLDATFFKFHNPYRVPSGVDDTFDALVSRWGSSVALDDAVDPGVWFGAPNSIMYSPLSRLMGTSEWVVVDSVSDSTRDSYFGSGTSGSTFQPDMDFPEASAFVQPWSAASDGTPELWCIAGKGVGSFGVYRMKWTGGQYESATGNSSVSLTDDSTSNAYPQRNPNGFSFDSTWQSSDNLIGTFTLPELTAVPGFKVFRDSRRRNVLHMIVGDQFNRWIATSMDDGKTWAGRKTPDPMARDYVVGGEAQTGFTVLGPMSASCFTLANVPVYGLEDSWRYLSVGGSLLPFWNGTPVDAGAHAALFFPLSADSGARILGDVVNFKWVSRHAPL